MGSERLFPDFYLLDIWAIHVIPRYQYQPRSVPRDYNEFVFILVIVIAYLLGSVPSADIASRLIKRKGIHESSDDNMGTLTVLREIGLLPGLLVFFADVAKGTLSVLVAERLGSSQAIVFIAGFAAVIGHNWPIFLNFRGGRGGATTFGVLLGFAPMAGTIAFIIMLLVIIPTSNARLALLAGFIAIPLFIWVLKGDSGIILYSIALPLTLGIHVLILDRKSLSQAEVKKNLIVDHDYTFWQKRRKQ